MKLAEHKSYNEIETPNEIKTFDFTLNAKAFKIFTDSIYKNKIRAVIRELTTNAIDAHKEAGNNNAYEVHLPEYQEEYFSIRDYGTGLSESQIEKIYTNFFFSTKENSNDFNGMLGLGSKSPLCYNTKSFTIESFYNGTKYVYLCFLDDDEIPSYTKVSDEATSEPNGLKIQFAANYSDIHIFEKEAQAIYQYVELKPSINTTISPLNKRYENDHFFCAGEKKSHILMGNVLYPLEVGHDSLKEYEAIFNTGIIIPVPNGSVEFSPSRESLSYNSYTVSFLRKKMKEIISFFEKDIETKINNSKSVFEAQRKYAELLEDFIFFPTKTFCKNVTYNGQVISLDLTFQNEITQYYHHSYSRKVNCSLTKHIRINSRDLFVYKDCKDAGSRVAEKIRRPSYNSPSVTAYMITDEFLQETGIQKSELILASTLPKPTTVYIREKISGICEWKNDSRITYSWVQVNDYDTGFYVIKDNGYAVIDGKKIHPRKIRELKITETIYGIGKKQEKDALKNGLKSLDEYVKNTFLKQKRILDKNRKLLEKYKAYDYITWAIKIQMNYLNFDISFKDVKVKDDVYNDYLEYLKLNKICPKILDKIQPYLSFSGENVYADQTLINTIKDKIKNIKIPTYQELLEKHYENSI